MGLTKGEKFDEKKYHYKAWWTLNGAGGTLYKELDNTFPTAPTVITLEDIGYYRMLVPGSLLTNDGKCVLKLKTSNDSFKTYRTYDGGELTDAGYIEWVICDIAGSPVTPSSMFLIELEQYL